MLASRARFEVNENTLSIPVRIVESARRVHLIISRDPRCNPTHTITTIPLTADTALRVSLRRLKGADPSPYTRPSLLNPLGPRQRHALEDQEVMAELLQDLPRRVRCHQRARLSQTSDKRNDGRSKFLHRAVVDDRRRPLSGRRRVQGGGEIRVGEVLDGERAEEAFHTRSVALSEYPGQLSRCMSMFIMRYTALTPTGQPTD